MQLSRNKDLNFRYFRYFLIFINSDSERGIRKSLSYVTSLSRTMKDINTELKN
jgi:hypothetical protein